MPGVHCTNCGHLNPEGVNFCSSCGEPMARTGELTLVLHAVDQLQDAPGPADDVRVELNELAGGSGVLVVRTGPQAGLRIVLDRPTLRVGRHPDSDVVLDDITVSRRHAEITRKADRYVIRDVGSLNGTYLNQQRVDEVELSNGDEVQVGKFRMVFLDALEGRV